MSIIELLCFDLIFIVETHLKNVNDVITMQNYTWYGKNRSVIHNKAKKSSGGVGWLVRNPILNDFNVTTDTSSEGIVCLKCEHKSESYCLYLIGCYLPPENSPWGREATQFFDQIETIIYNVTDANMVLVCGDFNGRIGGKSDCIDVIDKVPERKPIDKICNKHGDSLVEFMKESKMCALNGRYPSDNFTCISSKGKSVVDYMIVPHDCLSDCISFDVLLCSELISKFNLQQNLHSRCKIPDHSVLCVNLVICFESISADSKYIYDHDDTCTIEIEPDNTIVTNVMNNEMRIKERYCFTFKWFEAIACFTILTDNLVTLQEFVDVLNEHLCALLKCEMHNYLKPLKNRPRVNSVHTRSVNKNKLFWNDELATLWQTMKINERKFIKCKDNRETRSIFLADYRSARAIFDKKLRQCERIFNQNKCLELESKCPSNPKDFWRYIKSLGPRRNSLIPIKVHEQNGFNTNPEFVLNRWKLEFESLYSPTYENEDNEFYSHVLYALECYEQNMNETNFMVNESISYDEIETAVNKLKIKKATGPDDIPNEVLKNRSVILALCKLFQCYFVNGIIISHCVAESSN